MGKKTSKAFACILAAALSVTGLAGCGNSQTDKESTTQVTTAVGSTTKEGSLEVAGEMKAFDKQVEINIPVYDRATEGAAPVDNNYWTKWIQKEFGDKYNVKVSYTAIPRSDEVNSFNMKLAAGNAPDIIFHYDYPSAVAYNDMGALKELDMNQVKQIAPTYYKNMEDAGILEYCKIDGKDVFIAATRPDAYNNVTLIRQDWLDECGLAMPTNIEEFEAALVAFKEKKLGGETTIPLTMQLPVSGYVVNYPTREYPLDERENALYSDLSIASFTWKPTYEQLKINNRFYNKSLISSEYYLDTDGSKMMADFTSGKAGIYSCFLSTNPDIIGSLMKNCPEAKLSVLDSGALFAKGAKPTARKYWPFGMIMGINQASSDDEAKACLMLLEWMAQEDNLFTLQNGIEGKTYEMKDGIPVMLEYDGEERMNYNSNKDMYCLVSEGKQYGDPKKDLEVQKFTFAPKGYEYIIQDFYDIAQRDQEYWYTDYLFSTNIKSVATHRASLLSKWQEYSVKLTTCKPEEFEALYEKFSKDYLDSGYQEILDERAAAYDASK